MARPKGFRLNGPVFLDLIKAKGLDLSAAAKKCRDEDGKPLPLTTLSGLVNDDHGASIATVRQITDGLNIDEAIFPELTGRFSYITKEQRASTPRAA
jgi:hypothetical protein